VAFELDEAQAASQECLSCLCALLTYAEQSMGQALDYLSAPLADDRRAVLQIDSVARRTLELFSPLYAQPDTASTTLLAAIDRCETVGGSRQLRDWLMRPLQTSAPLQARQDAVAWLAHTDEALRDLQSGLRPISDLARLAGRLSLRQSRPRELIAIAQSCQATHHLSTRLAYWMSASPSTTVPAGIEAIAHRLRLQSGLACAAQITAALLDDPAPQIRDGGVIRDGYDPDLDELRALRSEGNQFLLALETEERARTGISTLRVGFNAVHGYYIEVSAGQKDRVPEDYQRRQTLKNAERYITPGLKAYEEKALSAQERALARERHLYEELLTALSAEVHGLQQMAGALAELDALLSMASFMVGEDWVLPELAEGACIEIEDGRHPVLAPRAGEFTPNSVSLDSSQRMLVITGPNMGGKSTFMRQVALITILARIGSAVPARHARIGRIDRIFTRIGAADDLAGGRSTFMVEMTEAALILNRAGPYSLVLMDEIGRGTSTQDGLALAWSIAEHLANTNQALALFATHYFELTALADQQPAVANVHVSAVEHNQGIVFLHEIAPGAASQSFGLAVARLAGLPDAVIARAQSKNPGLSAEPLARRSSRSISRTPPKTADKLAAMRPQLGLFSE
jgi:DNA mismatch repair protein MutS